MYKKKDNLEFMLKPKKSVENMSGYFVPLFEKKWNIKIDSNENNYGPSPKVIEALKKCSLNEVSFYPFYGELSDKIAQYNGFNIENIKVTNGADEAIQGIIQTYLEKEEALLTLDVSFDMPVIYTQIQGGNVIKVPFKEKWVFPLEEFINELENKNVKIVYLASPNNPTGNVIDEYALNRILDKSDGKVVLIDETYANYAGITYKEYVRKYDNVFIVRSFSKDFALAGMRLGYIISCEENIYNLKKVISPFSVNSFAMVAGIFALDDIEYFSKIKKEVSESKSELKKLYESLGAVVYESKANFLLASFNQKADFIYNKLKNAGISVKLFKKESLLKGCIRTTIPTKSGMKKIKEVLQVKPSLVFDMDGVLANAVNSYRKTIEETYEIFSGKKITQEEIQSAKNLGGLNNDWDLTKYLLNKQGINIKYNDIIDVFQKIYWNDGKGLINNENILFKREIFEKLSEKYNLSIFTGRLKQEALFFLEKFGVVDLFYPIITTDDIMPGKGKPDPYGLNMLKEQTISNNYYYFGDTIDDIKAAKAAGYFAIGVLPPQDKSDFLKQNMKLNGAEYIIDSINDINLVLEQKNEAVL